MVTKNCFITVVDGLEAFAIHINLENKAEAQKTINAISSDIAYLCTMAEEKAEEYKHEIDTISAEVSEVIQREADIRENSLQIQIKIGELNVSITSQQTNHQQLIAHINQLAGDIGVAQAELRAHKVKLDELNDTSVGSIFRSIFCLGLDRAVMGIASLIDDDIGRIIRLGQEINCFHEQIHNDDIGQREALAVLKRFNEQKDSSERLVAELHEREITLHSFIKENRRKLGFFVDIALFYGKLATFTHQIDHRLDDVIDLVNELQSTDETIVDVDGSGKSLISLKDALLRFEEMAKTCPSHFSAQGRA